MKASILKSTQSSNGGFVNTLQIEGVKKDAVLGDMIVKDRFYFKSPTQLVEEGADPKEVTGFALGNYSINPIESIDEATGATRINKWLTPKA